MTRETKVPKTLETKVLALLKTRYKIKDPVIVDTRRDTLRKTKQPIHQFRVVSRADANGPQYEVVLDKSGAELVRKEISERDGVEYFPLLLSRVAKGKLPGLKAWPKLVKGITVSPTENHLVLNYGDSQSETVTVTVPPEVTVPKADIYFLADTTGSMAPYIAAVQAGANDILAALGLLGYDLAFGVGNYKDFPPHTYNPYAFQHQLSITNVASDVTNAINAWGAFGGKDGAEGQLFALDQLAVPPGGPIGWRTGAQHIIVWFGDAPGHDPICQAISGLSYEINESLVKSKLQSLSITVLAISTTTPGLNANPSPMSNDYSGICSINGMADQATNIAGTEGECVTGIDPAHIVDKIIELVTIAVESINNLKLVPSGATAPFVTSISPAGGYGPLPSDTEHTLKFKVQFTGVQPCEETEQTFYGTLNVVADGVVVAKKKVEIKVPPCAATEACCYNVKFVCGIQPDDPRRCLSVRPGIYATEINIHNYHDKTVKVLKKFVPVVFGEKPVGREPRVEKPQAVDSVSLPPHTTTMDDCCRIAELFFGEPAPSPIPLTIGVMEITSTEELSVTAVYTASDLKSGSVSIDVERFEAVRTGPD